MQFSLFILPFSWLSDKRWKTKYEREGMNPVLPTRFPRPLSGHQLQCATLAVLKFWNFSSTSKRIKLKSFKPILHALCLKIQIVLSCVLSVGGLAAGIEWLIIKFDLCVYFDYCSLLTSEALWPWGIQYVNCLALVGNSSSSSSSRVCVCALCICVCYDGQGQLLPAPLPWYFPTEKCLISERAHGVLENESSNGCWQRPWKSMITNVVMPVSDSDHTDAESDLISICNVLAWRGYRTQGVYKISFISAASLKNDHCYFIG